MSVREVLAFSALLLAGNLYAELLKFLYYRRNASVQEKAKAAVPFVLCGVLAAVLYFWPSMLWWWVVLFYLAAVLLAILPMLLFRARY